MVADTETRWMSHEVNGDLKGQSRWIKEPAWRSSVDDNVQVLFTCSATMFKCSGYDEKSSTM